MDLDLGGRLLPIVDSQRDAPLLPWMAAGIENSAAATDTSCFQALSLRDPGVRVGCSTTERYLAVASNRSDRIRSFVTMKSVLGGERAEPLPCCIRKRGS